MTVFEKWARVPGRNPVAFYVSAAFAVLVMTLVMYKGTFHYGYLDWDDNTLVEQNPYVIRPPYLQHALDMFVPGRAPGPHLPIRSASYIFDREVLGKGAPDRVPPGVSPDAVWTRANYHHLVNVFLYAINGLLLLWCLARLLPPWAAVIGTLIWLAHPVHVEAVCWVSGRKEMLAGGFVFASLLAYMYGTERLGPEADKPKPLWIAAGLTAAATLVSVLWWKHPLTSLGFVHGLVSLALLLGGCIAYGVASGGERRWNAGILLALAVLFALAGAMSKPVAICIAPILIAWEIGFRPRRKPAAAKLAPANAAGASDAAAAAPAGSPVVAWVRTHLFDRDEFLGLVSRQLPQIAIAAWGSFMTLFLAGKNQVVKEATWNAAAKNQNVAAFSALWLDIYHLVAPLDLSSLYDVKSDHWYWTAYAGIAILIAIPVLAVWLLRKNPKSILWLAFWLVPLIPVSGIIRLASIHADRYLYLPAVALAVGLGVLLATAAFGSDEETGAWERVVAAVLTVAIVGGFTVLSWQRARVWERDEYLWGDAVRKNPDLPSARNNYGAALMNAGKVNEALEQYYAAYKILPSLDVAQFNIAATEMRLGHPEKAQKYAEEFSAQHPEMPTGWILLGQVYLGVARQQGPTTDAGKALVAKAEGAFDHGCDLPVDKDSLLQLQDRVSACNQAAMTRISNGDKDGGEKSFKRGLELAEPGSNAMKQTVFTYAHWLLQEKRNDEAWALVGRLDPHDPDVLRAKYKLYYEDGKLQESLASVEELLRSGRAVQQDLDARNAIMQRIQAEAAAKPTATPAPGAKKSGKKDTSSTGTGPKAALNTATPAAAAVAP